MITWVEVETGESHFFAPLELLQEQIPAFPKTLTVRGSTVHQVRPMGDDHVRVEAILLINSNKQS